MTQSETQDTRPLCILVGTCISFGIQYLLMQSEEFKKTYRMKAYRTHQHYKIMSDFPISDDDLNEASVFIYHPPGWADWGNDDGYRELLQRVPDHVQKISFPYPVFHALWPLHAHDKRLDDPNRKAGFGHSDAIYAYGDSFLLSQIRQGLSTEEIVRRYLDLNIPDIVDVDGILKRSIDTQIAKEETTDVKIIDFAVENFRTKRAFVTMNHVGNVSLIHMANQMLRMMGLSPLPASLHDSLFELIDPQMPIHPSVIRHFGLTCVTPETRYRLDPRRNLNFLEYLTHYIELL